MTKTASATHWFRTAALLLLLVLVSFYCLVGLYARYGDRKNSEDGARVATFAVETDLDRISLGLGDGVAPSFTIGGEDEVDGAVIPFYIHNGSEVAVTYDVTADFGTPLPDYVTLTLTDGTVTRTLSADGAQTAYTFADFGFIGVGEDTSLTLSLTVSDLTAITDEVSIPTAALTVRVVQVD